MTERLYPDNPDLLEFSARVIRCEQTEEGCQIVLDRTAFFPEGGGQGADYGMLGNATVLDVQERGDEVFHLTDSPLQEGTMVQGKVDAIRRLDMMQQHSGEHIFSGLVCRTYGCSNVGFHIGTDAVTMDFDRVLTEEEAKGIEHRANQVIWADVPVRAWVPPREELAAIDYRSKKALEGDIRLVQIPDVDICACCGTHVQRTGRVGQVKLLSVQKYKKGVRVSILCGRRALEYENLLMDQLKHIANALSGKQLEAGEAVDRLLQERDELRAGNEALSFKLFEQQANAVRGQMIRVIACAELSQSLLRRAASRLAEGARVGIVLTPREEGWSFACASAEEDIRPLTRELLAAFGGRGGGPADMTQGALAHGTTEEIRAMAEQMMNQK